MSKIGNQLVEQKLKELLAGHENVDYSKFDDNTALIVIFSTFQERVTFSELIAERYIKEIEELKLAQMQLRAQLKEYNQRQKDSLSEKCIGKECEDNIFEQERKQYQQKVEKLLQIGNSQREELQQFQKRRQQLENKILQITQKWEEASRQLSDTNQQLQSYMKNDQENRKVIERLTSEKETIVLEQQQTIKKYQQQFVEKLVETLKSKHEDEKAESEKLNQKLSYQFKDLEAKLQKIVSAVSKIFKIQQPANLSSGIDDWLEELERRFKKYCRQIKVATNMDIREVEDPIRVLTDYHARQIEFRERTLNSYLSK